MFGKSYLISLAVRWLLPKGLDWLKEYSESKAAEIETAIRDIVPGTDFDDAAWHAVEGLLEGAFSICGEIVAVLGDVVPTESHVARAVAAVGKLHGAAAN